MCMSVHCQNSDEETNLLRRIRRILSDGHARLRVLGALPGPDQLLPTSAVSKVAVAVANKAGEKKSKAAKSKSETRPPSVPTSRIGAWRPINKNHEPENIYIFEEL